MPGQNSIVVSKPYVPFSRRLVDPDLQRLTVAQLRKKARARNLDLSRLTHKWEFIHVLTEEYKRGARAHVENTTDPKRHTFFDLPGEVRNMIYGHVLVHDGLVIANYTYNRYPRILAFLFAPEPDQGIVISRLRKMSWANRELRKEVRAFFFSNNIIGVKGDMVSSRSDFLDNIGADGRANLVTLGFVDANFQTYNYGFRSMFASCTKLQNLTIQLDIGLILTDDTYTALRDLTLAGTIDWDKNGCQINVNRFMEIFTLLPALQNLSIICVVTNWRLAGSSSTSARQHRFLSDRARAIEQAVSKTTEKVLEGRGIYVMVNSRLGTPLLHSDE
jgi:hypothetical protein